MDPIPNDVELTRFIPQLQEIAANALKHRANLLKFHDHIAQMISPAEPGFGEQCLQLHLDNISLAHALTPDDFTLNLNCFFNETGDGSDPELTTFDFTCLNIKTEASFYLLWTPAKQIVSNTLPPHIINSSVLHIKSIVDRASGKIMDETLSIKERIWRRFKGES